tara:strand:- start:4652 stop:4837 length:186 start_codon:yes stop_codon:yes gene_type:complete
MLHTAIIVMYLLNNFSDGKALTALKKGSPNRHLKPYLKELLLLFLLAASPNYTPEMIGSIG